MRRPFRYVNEIAGAFVLLGLLLLAAALMLAARSSGWFQKERRFAVTLPPEGSFGLRPGAEVRILGTVVGRVTDIGIDHAGNMRAGVAILEDFGRFVRTDSVALVQKTYVVAGTAFLEITRGEGEPLPPGGTVGSKPFEELPKLLEGILGGIREEALAALEDLRGATREYTALAAEARDRDGNLQRALANLQELLATVNRGEGTIGRLVRDPALAERLEATAARIDSSAGEADLFFRDLRASASEARELVATLRAEAAELRGAGAAAKGVLVEAQALLADARASTTEVPRLVAGAADAVGQLPGVLLQTQATMREVQRLVQGMRGNWLFGGGSAAPPRSARISPQAAGGR
jgi:phospholipid/cholesterol/gamma-HCH transport system substrate-binding protein